MHLSHVVIKNFRALENVDIDLTPHMNVIVGPNAVGKTTILQAIRLCRALLAPRTAAEANQALISLGAASPHFPQKNFFGVLARDSSKPVEVRCTYKLSELEVSAIEQSKTALVQRAFQANLGQPFANPATFVQFMSSPEGQTAIANITQQLGSPIENMKKNKSLLLGLTLDAASGQIRSAEGFAGLALAFLEQNLNPFVSQFSFFPADRALPHGETPVQLGAADTQQQLEAHNSQPHLKYQRLKNVIFNSIVMGDEHHQNLKDEFRRIFDGILRGRQLKKIGTNDIGLLTVQVEDTETGRIYEIDTLSSGEKNLALTFLLIARSISPGGIVLFDEPELHLNPSVCKELLKFTLDSYAIPRNLQFIMCTHSPEILSGAFEDDRCALFHLISPTNISRVGRKALDEYSEALAKLGSTVSEALLYRGTVFVEGDDDVAFLEEGYRDLLKRFKIKDRGGRKEVEKVAADLQRLEAEGARVDPVLLIFDRDDLPSNLRSSNAVHVLQWSKRCLENYLLDLDVITDLLKSESIANNPVRNEGDARKVFRDLAFAQLDEVVAREMYSTMGYVDPGLRPEDVSRGDLVQMAEALYTRADNSRRSLALAPRNQWVSDFTRRCGEKRKELEPVWEANWRDLCDGKRLFKDLPKKGILRISAKDFKRRILRQMTDMKSENWRLVESLLKDHLPTESSTAQPAGQPASTS